MQPQFNTKWEHINNLYYADYRNDSCTLQFHAQIELYFVDEGEMEFQVGGRQATLKAEQISVALEYVTHAYKTPSASRSSILVIPPPLCRQFLSLIREKRVEDPFIRDEAVYRRIRPYYDALKNAADNPILLQGFLYVILGIIYENLSFEKSPTAINPDLTARILSYIEKHHAEELSPSALAEALDYSHSYLARYFRTHFGITLGQYLSAVKLKHALSLILEDRMSVTDCALESGFSSVSSFYRAFRKEFNCSPSEYMKMIHQ